MATRWFERLFYQWKGSDQEAIRGKFTEAFRIKYQHFKTLLDSNNELGKIIADMEEKLRGQQLFGMNYVKTQSTRSVFHALRMITSLESLAGRKYPAFYKILEQVNGCIKEELEKRTERPVTELICPYTSITREMVDWVGGKNANLGEILNKIHLPIPPGFAITTLAFDRFLAASDLADEISKKTMELDPHNLETLNQVSEEIQRLIMTAPVPADVSEAIIAAYDELAGGMQQGGSAIAGAPLVAMRSSAIGEDSEHSFAGQYVSLLNVPREKILQSYTYILASLYTPRAIAYRLNKGIRDEDIAMSVACLVMVDAVASGVAYSHHPFNLLENHVLVSAVWGLGPYAVDGTVTPDSYKVAKDQDLTIMETLIAQKPVQLVCNPQGGLTETAVMSDKQAFPCLSTEQITSLARSVIALEEHFNYPQDVEWALDREGRIVILQSRPLHLKAVEEGSPAGAISIMKDYPLLAEHGTVVFPGVGCGSAFQVHSDEDLANFPEGAVLVAKHSSPKFVVAMPKACAIVTDAGSVTGHMASLSREFGIPTIVGVQGATSSLSTGTEITVDAYSGRVYHGKVPELLRLQTPRQSHTQDTPVFQTLRRVADVIVPLRLFDPHSPAFVPEHCRSLHDIMRVIHEFSYQEMFRISDLVSEKGKGSLKLNAPIPLDLHIIDLGGGLSDVGEKARKVSINQVVSAPFKALLKGLLHEDLRFQRPRPIELKGFLSVMSEQMLAANPQQERFGERSYAIISDKYLNFSSRVGYHYSILDCYCGQSINKNYITFTFMGGAADDVRRNRRARAIALIFSSLDFVIEVVADRVDARIKKYEASTIEEKLDLIGRMLQFTRQMDMLMINEDSVERLAESFLEGKYDL